MHTIDTLKNLSIAEDLINKTELCITNNFELANERYSIAHKLLYDKENTLDKKYCYNQIQDIKKDINLISDGAYLEYKINNFNSDLISTEGFLNNISSMLKNTKDKIIEFIKNIIKYIQNLFKNEKIKNRETKLAKITKEDISNINMNIKNINTNKIKIEPTNIKNNKNDTIENIVEEITNNKTPEVFLTNLIKLIKVNSLFNIISTIDLTKEDREMVNLYSDWDKDYKSNLNNVSSSLENFIKNIKNKCNFTDAINEITEAINNKIIIPEDGIKSIKVMTQFINQIYSNINSDINSMELNKLQKEIDEKLLSKIKDIIVYSLKDINKITDNNTDLIYNNIQLLNKELKNEVGLTEQNDIFLTLLLAFTKMNGLAFSKYDLLTRSYIELMELSINVDKDILEKEMFEANMKMFDHDYELVCEAFNLEDNIRRDLENLNEKNREEINARYYVYNNKINGNMSCEKLSTEQLKVSLEGFMDSLKMVGGKIVEVIKKLIEYIIKGFDYIISFFRKSQVDATEIDKNIEELLEIMEQGLSSEAYSSVGTEIPTSTIAVTPTKDFRDLISSIRNYKSSTFKCFVYLIMTDFLSTSLPADRRNTDYSDLRLNIPVRNLTKEDIIKEIIPSYLIASPTLSSVHRGYITSQGEDLFANIYQTIVAGGPILTITNNIYVNMKAFVETYIPTLTHKPIGINTKTNGNVYAESLLSTLDNVFATIRFNRETDLEKDSSNLKIDRAGLLFLLQQAVCKTAPFGPIRLNLIEKHLFNINEVTRIKNFLEKTKNKLFKMFPTLTREDIKALLLIMSCLEKFITEYNNIRTEMSKILSSLRAVKTSITTTPTSSITVKRTIK